MPSAPSIDEDDDDPDPAEQGQWGERDMPADLDVKDGTSADDDDDDLAPAARQSQR